MVFVYVLKVMWKTIKVGFAKASSNNQAYSLIELGCFPPKCCSSGHADANVKMENTYWQKFG